MLKNNLGLAPILIIFFILITGVISYFAYYFYFLNRTNNQIGEYYTYEFVKFKLPTPNQQKVNEFLEKTKLYLPDCYESSYFDRLRYNPDSTRSSITYNIPLQSIYQKCSPQISGSDSFYEVFNIRTLENFNPDSFYIKSDLNSSQELEIYVGGFNNIDEVTQGPSIVIKDSKNRYNFSILIQLNSKISENEFEGSLEQQLFQDLIKSIDYSFKSEFKGINNCSVDTCKNLDVTFQTYDFIDSSRNIGFLDINFRDMNTGNRLIKRIYEAENEELYPANISKVTILGDDILVFYYNFQPCGLAFDCFQSEINHTKLNVKTGEFTKFHSGNFIDLTTINNTVFYINPNEIYTIDPKTSEKKSFPVPDRLEFLKNSFPNLTFDQNREQIISVNENSVITKIENVRAENVNPTLFVYLETNYIEGNIKILKSLEYDYSNYTEQSFIDFEELVSKQDQEYGYTRNTGITINDSVLNLDTSPKTRDYLESIRYLK